MLTSSVLVCLSWLSVSLALPAPEAPSTAPTCEDCERMGIKPHGDETQYESYRCSSDLLGPKKLPVKEPLRSIMAGYSPFGDLCPNKFLDKYWDPTAGEKGTGDWRWPQPRDAEGFKVGTDNKAIMFSVNVTEGTYFDRFGTTKGRFLSLACTPYTQRAIPPVNLANGTRSELDHPFNYHVYRANKNFSIVTGPSQPAFAQTGLGLQFWTGKNKTVGTLIAEGDLVEVKPEVLVKLEGCHGKADEIQNGFEMGEL